MAKAKAKKVPGLDLNDRVPAFTGPDGKQYEAVAPLSELRKLKHRRALLKMSEVAATFYVLELLFDEDAMAVLDELDTDSAEFEDIMAQVFEDEGGEGEGVGLGEDSTSSE